MPVLAQQPKFEIADVHASITARRFAMKLGGVLRDGKYINRDATILNMIEAAYGVSEDIIVGGPNWVEADLFDVVAKDQALSHKGPERCVERQRRIRFDPLSPSV